MNSDHKAFYFTQKNFLNYTLLFLFTFGLIWLIRFERLNSPHALIVPKKETAAVYLSEHTSFEGLFEALDEAGVRYDRQELEWAGRILGWRNYRAGRYEIYKMSTYDAFLSELTLGHQDPLNITILPGTTREWIASRLGTKLKADSADFAKVLRDKEFLNKHRLDTNTFFGRILPETYKVFWSTSPESFYERVLNEFDRIIIQEHQSRIQELRFNIDEIVTLASIIEWEAKVDSEKKRISGLYWNRLNRRMALQADPTVVYALGERRRLTYDDYRIDHPFNTYNYRGLPPGPITNPSQSSIEAALYPEDHNYLYMVAQPGEDGLHSFSRTYSQHQQKSRQWQRWIREQYRLKRLREQNGK